MFVKLFFEIDNSLLSLSNFVNEMLDIYV